MFQFRFFSTPLFSCWQRIACIGLVSLGLYACDQDYKSAKHPVMQKKTEDELVPVRQERQAVGEQGNNLLKVAGQATLPHARDSFALNKPRPEDMVFVGRYVSRIPCTDAFAGCVKKEKESEYIINLMGDGMVYWKNTSFGRLGSDPTNTSTTKIEQTCKHVQWYRRLDEIIIRCDPADLNFYYKIQQDHNLILDLEKTKTGEQGSNRKFFEEYPFPEQPYLLEKVQ